MLQFPTSVYPQNIAIDANTPTTVHCVFNGDIMKSVWFRAYDYYTKARVTTQKRFATVYNGEDGGITLSMSQFSNGNDYVFQMMYTQGTADGTENIYDMPIVRDVILGASGTSITLKSGIPNIYEWNVSNNVCSPTIDDNKVYAGAIIKVGSESHFVESYNRKTGELIVDQAFSTDVTGKSYVVLCNYLVTPQYYFMCREAPTLTVSKRLVSSSVQKSPDIHIMGEYEQSDGSMIKYYTVYLYQIITGLGLRLIRKSPKVYSQRIDYNIGNCWVDQGDETITYRASCDVVTQDGETVSAYVDFNITANNEIVVYDGLSLIAVDNKVPDYISASYSDLLNHQCVSLVAHRTESSLDFVVDVYRRDLETNKVTHLFGNYRDMFDWSVPNKGKFEYVVLPRNRETAVPYVGSRVSAQIETNFMGYSITELKLVNAINQYNKRELYRKGQCWEFAGTIDDTTTTQNINREIQAGHGKFTVASSGESNYLTGTLTADLGFLDCPENKYKDTIDMVNAWRDFISRDSIYMLKTKKGDVLLVNIFGTPTVEYDEGSPLIPARVSFEWAECESLDNVDLRMN